MTGGYSTPPKPTARSGAVFMLGPTSKAHSKHISLIRSNGEIGTTHPRKSCRLLSPHGAPDRPQGHGQQHRPGKEITIAAMQSDNERDYGENQPEQELQHDRPLKSEVQSAFPATLRDSRRVINGRFL
jgi:hypothetical protein